MHGLEYKVPSLCGIQNDAGVACGRPEGCGFQWALTNDASPITPNRTKFACGIGRVLRLGPSDSFHDGKLLSAPV